MSGQGKYTNYSDKIPGPDAGGTSSAKLDFLGKLFKGAPDLSMKAVLDRAKMLLTPSTQKADVTTFGGNVDLDYKGAPNMADVKWKNPGDPSTPYTPDIRSPGPAAGIELSNMNSVVTNVTPHDQDPSLKVSDLAPNYIVGAPGTGTNSPNLASPKVAAQELGSSQQSVITGAGSDGEIYK